MMNHVYFVSLSYPPFSIISVTGLNTMPLQDSSVGKEVLLYDSTHL